jgi:single-strand DNA-binding protein
MYNTIIAAGYLVNDPITRNTNTGKTICTMRMCISENNAKNKCFIDVEAWEKTAEVCSKFLAKGREVLVEGELCLSSWQGSDGKTQSKNFIRANRVKFLGGGAKKSDDAPAAASGNSAPASNDGGDEDEIPF